MPDEQLLLDVIAENREGILAVVTRAGYPHLTSVLYVWDAVERTARVSTTADRVKAGSCSAIHAPRCTFRELTSGHTLSPSAMRSSPPWLG